VFQVQFNLYQLGTDHKSAWKLFNQVDLTKSAPFSPIM